MTCVDNLKGAMKNLENLLKEEGSTLKNFGDGKRPYPSSYCPKIDVTPEPDTRFLNRYQQLIGILRWAIELGRIDMLTEVSCILEHLCSPREGHLNSIC